MDKVKHFVMPCFNLHHFAGHEFMYTKEFKSALVGDINSNKYQVIIYSRADVDEKIQAELNCSPYYSHVEYRQDDKFFKKFSALFRREYLWYSQNKNMITSLPAGSIIFVHSFSIYSTWQWIFLNKYILKNSHKLKLVFRYSEKLLPSFLKYVHRYICRKLGEHIYAEVFTDSEELKVEYEQYCNKVFKVLPVMAETEVVQKEFALQKAKTDKKIVSYLGAARSDKGFHLLPEVVKDICSNEKNTSFLIQASVPGTQYLEKECEHALAQLFAAQREYPGRVEIIVKPVDQVEYRDLLKKTSILLLPYIGHTYKTQTSGILVEATTNGIPCIVPRDTWLSEQLKNTGGGIALEVEKPEELIVGLRELISNYPKYHALSVNSMEEEKLKHGARAQLKCVLGD